MSKAQSDSENKTPIQPAAPLKPRRRLLILFSVLFSLWIIAMIVMYFETVAPHKQRSPHSTEATAALPH